MTTDHIASLLDPNCPLTTETRIWLATSFRLHLEKNIPLHRALAFDRREYLFSKRNRHLCQAFSYLDTHRSQSYRCQTLLTIIDKFMWVRRDHSEDNPDPEWSPQEAEIFHAIQCRLGIPDLRMLKIIVAKV